MERSKNSLYTVLIGLVLINLVQFVECSLTGKDEQRDSPGRRLLAGPDFRLSARTMVIKPGGLFMVTDEIITEEYYSNSQRRALVQLHRVDAYDREQADLHSEYHYHDGQIVQNPMYGKKKCGPVGADQLANKLFGKLKISKDWLRVRVAVPDYIIGLARLLFVIDYHRNSLLQSGETEASQVKIRNHAAILYELPTSEEDDFGSNGKLRIYYAETQEHFGGFDLPMRIQFRDKDFGNLLIDFSFVGPLQEDLIEHEESMYPMDDFALPIGIGCSEKMDAAFKTGWRTVPVQVASFQAEIFKHNKLGTKQSSISKRFVAFDSYAGAMRSDAKTSNSYSTTVIDFWNKKKYNILYGGSQYEKITSKRPCVASKVADTDQYRAFLPFKELVYMGQATVRGVDCYVFEHITKDLPPAIFPLLTFTNLDGKEETIFGRDSQTFSVIYYFAASFDEAKRKIVTKDLPSGPLMRIDVYNKETLQYHMDIFDYMNQLVAAPNGDRQEELFALKDRCSGAQLGNDGYADLALEIEYKPTSAKAKTAVDAREILQGQHLRNKAILRALARASMGIITKLSDIETRMKFTSSGQLKIYVEARLNMPDVELSEVRQIGWSSLETGQSKVKTIEECFQWAAHAQSGSDPVLFVSCANSCDIDLSPAIEFEKDKKTIKSVKSNIYKADPKRSSSKSCPAMLIESKSHYQEPQSRLSQMRSVGFNWIRSDFEKKIMRLLMPNEGIFDVSSDDLIFDVNKVDIYNDKWSVALGYEAAHHRDDNDTLFKKPSKGYPEAIDGLGLTEANGELQALRQKESSVDEEPTMNYHTCHSICMAKLSCRSFSICITRRGIECIISEVDLRDRSMLKEIEAKLDEDKQSGKDRESDSLKVRTIVVANPRRAIQSSGDDSSDSDEEDPVADYEQVELKVDFRCKLYKKNVLEMFHKQASTSVALKNSTLMPVDSQEKCAEICLKNNMIFFKKMAKTRLEILQNNEDELEDEELVKRLRDEYGSNLMSWCSTFHFLSTSSPDINEKTESFIDPKKLTRAGLCVIARSPDIKKQKQEDSSEKEKNDSKPAKEKLGPRVKFESFQFLYSNLFDVQYGIMLEEAEEDDQGKPLPAINKSLRKYTSDAESCARICFLQTSGLEPWCKSFDFIESRASDGGSKSIQPVTRYCDFHTLSLAEIRLNGMAEFMVTDLSKPSTEETDQSSGSISTGLIRHAWHYDSRDAYTLEDAVLSELVLVKSEATLFDSMQAYRLHALGVMTILLAALVLSAAVVILHGENVVNRFSGARRDSISDPPRSFLSSLVSGSSQQSASSVGTGIRHKRFVASDQDLPDIPELNSI